MSVANTAPNRKRKASDIQVIPFSNDAELKESVYKLFETKRQIATCTEQLTKLRKISDQESKRIQLYMESTKESALSIDNDKLIYHKTSMKKPNPSYEDACSVIKLLVPEIDLKLIDQQVDRICEEKKEMVQSIETQMLMFKKI